MKGHHPTFAALLRAAMKREGVRSSDVSRATGLSISIITSYTSGRYLPQLHRAEILADALMAPELVAQVKTERRYKCRLESCQRMFCRQGGPQKFCSVECQRLSAKGLKVRVPNPAQDAIDEMCRSCEPEGTCRNDGCPLRQFSPLPFADPIGVKYIGNRQRAEKRAYWREQWWKRQGRVA